MAYKCVHTKINWSFLILNTEHTSPLNSIPSVTHCSNQWKEVSQNSKPQARFRESMSEQTHKHCLCEMRAHATRGETQNRGDHDKGKQETRIGYTHSAGAGMACQLSTGTVMEVSLMPSWQRWAAQLTLSNRRWGLLWMVSTATCQTQRHEGRGDMRVTGRGERQRNRK